MSVRWSKRVAAGLDSIYALASVELEACQLSELECRCASCCGPNEYGEDRPCQCVGKPFDKQCTGCQAVAEWAAAISWLGDQITKRKDH
jgi:hypothetical protein